jgi:hypothetical protein
MIDLIRSERECHRQERRQMRRGFRRHWRLYFRGWRRQAWHRVMPSHDPWVRLWKVMDA